MLHSCRRNAWGSTSLAAVGGVWAVIVALAAAILTLILIDVTDTCHRCAQAWMREPAHPSCRFSVSPAWSASEPLSAALPAFDFGERLGALDRGRSFDVIGCRHQCAGGPHRVGLGRADDRARRVGRHLYANCVREGIDPALMHRVAVIGAGTLDSLPHNGAVVTMLAVCGTTHRAKAISISSWSELSAQLSRLSR